MLLHRFLKYINIIIGIVLIAAAGAAYWYVWRPLPKTSGAVEAPVDGRVTVSRDDIGVPHIAAASIEDAVFAQGYAMAQDRLWQMDALRRRASGELAEVLGGGRPLELDRETRGFRFRRLAEQAEKKLPDTERAVLAAFARGVNYFIDTHRGSLPMEFTLLGYDPRPWAIRDSLLVIFLMFRDLNRMWRTEVLKSSMMAAGDKAKVEVLFPVRAGMDVQPGSNAWAVSGKLTSTGRPILAGDPHLEFSVPSVWYMNHLKARDLDVSGASFPGLPLVVLGHNQSIAWSATNLEADVQDLYLETFDAQTGRYLFRGQPQQAQLEREPIAVRKSRPVESSVWVTMHGPVILVEQNRHYALRWTAWDAAGFPLLELNRAQNWEQFRTALSHWTAPAQNFVYADSQGNIGFQVAGLVPVRKNYRGDVPVPGAGAEFEWAGYIPFDELPRVYNPPSGMIVSANQDPFPDNYGYKVNGAFAPYFRARQIRDRLASRKSLTIDDMLRIQTDVYSAFSHFLAGEVVAAYERRKANNPSLNTAVDLLKSWNGQMRHDLAAPLVASLVFQHLRKAVAERAAPGRGVVYATFGAPAVLEQLLRLRPKDWFTDWDQLLIRCLADAVEEGQRMQGQDPKKWKLGNYAELRLTHPVIGRVPYIGKYFDIGPAPMSGSSTTVKQSSQTLGPSMRMVLDTADWDRSVQNIVMGQSGQVLSSHYKDQWQAYYAGRSFRAQYRRIETKSVLTLDPLRQ